MNDTFAEALPRSLPCLGYGAKLLSCASNLAYLTDRQRNVFYVWSGIASLLRWVAKLLSILRSRAPTSGRLLAGSIAQCRQHHRPARRASLSAWYPTLRLLLISSACLCLAAGVFAGYHRAH